MLRNRKVTKSLKTDFLYNDLAEFKHFEVVSQDFGIPDSVHSTVLMTTGTGSKGDLIYAHYQQALLGLVAQKMLHFLTQ